MFRCTGHRTRLSSIVLPPGREGTVLNVRPQSRFTRTGVSRTLASSKRPRSLSVDYESVDKLQKMLAETVFKYAADKKKASGRALGTMVEIVTFYTLSAWRMRDHVAIERQIPEFANPSIVHNVEFSVHPISATRLVELTPLHLPVTSRKVLRGTGIAEAGYEVKPQVLLSKNHVMRNAAIVAERDKGFVTAHLSAVSKTGCTVSLTELLEAPFAIFECKRVGVEEGMHKGPQTIEKAKQGAYVARSVSSLQKVRLMDGQVYGVLDRGGGRLRSDAYDKILRQVIEGNDPELLRSFILTVGVVSNHGNWFTAENHNKELRVLAQSYDWLLFLTDNGLCQFIEKLLVKPVVELKLAREAFLASYSGKSGANCFTKVKVRLDADAALKRYFELHEPEVESWFNVISPQTGTIRQLRNDILKLAAKDWKRIREQ